jgi:branched-chain amino acid transport system permease protein
VFLLAAGLSVIFGLMDVLNLAHGAFYMLGAYLALTALRVTHSFWPALVLAPLALFAIGVVVELVFFRRLYRQGHLMQVLLTFGLSLVLVELVRILYGPANQAFAAPSQLAGTISILGSNFSTYRLFVIGVALVVGSAMLLAWHGLRIGAILRAGVADKEMVGLLGIDLKLVFTLTFAFGSALAGLAGVVAGPYLSVYPAMDENVLILALVVVVIGGLGSIEGAILGSIVIGLASSFSVLAQSYGLTVELLASAKTVIFVVMAIILLVRPRGLFGQPGQAR